MNASILIVSREINCAGCQHKFIYQADNFTLYAAQQYNKYLEETVNHLAKCQGEYNG